MIFYGLLIWVSYIYLDVKNNKKLFDIILSKSLFSVAICGMISEIFMRYFEFANVPFLMINHTKLVEKFAKPLIQYNSAQLLLVLYVIIAFFTVLATFLTKKENKKITTIMTFSCFFVSFLIFFCCPYFMVCYLFIFVPEVLGLFIVILSIKELLPSRRKERNIKMGKFKFVMCIIILIFIIINIVSNAFWIIFGEKILKILSIKPK